MIVSLQDSARMRPAALKKSARQALSRGEIEKILLTMAHVWT